MNAFEFSDLKETPSTGLGKICRWLTFAVLLTSLDTAALPGLASRTSVAFQAARSDARAASVERAAAFQEAAQQKQESKDGGWEAAFDAVNPGQRSR